MVMSFCLGINIDERCPRGVVDRGVAGVDEDRGVVDEDCLDEDKRLNSRLNNFELRPRGDSVHCEDLSSDVDPDAETNSPRAAKKPDLPLGLGDPPIG